ncbi:MAG: SUMF1/EgtB/PvdO family nonheme iron enzyme [Phycisphaerae bacterium]|nr:SUMF1/EgtB/PvdO family nonheme iron enzyme [Phycisphaerae bacterium]
MIIEFSQKGQGRSTRRLIRGGSWNNSASNCRVANRNNNDPDNRNNNNGFRVCVVVVSGLHLQMNIIVILFALNDIIYGLCQRGKM